MATKSSKKTASGAASKKKTSSSAASVRASRAVVSGDVVDRVNETDAAAAAELDLKIENIQEAIDFAERGFFEIGGLLQEIADRKLHLVRYKSFGDFVGIEFGMTDRNARSLMTAADVVRSLRPNFQTLPTSTREATALSKYRQEHRVRVWKSAVEAAKSDNAPRVGERRIAAAAAKLRDQAEEIQDPAAGDGASGAEAPAPAPKDSGSSAAPAAPGAESGVPGPDPKLAVYSDEFAEVYRAVTALKKAVGLLAKSDGARFLSASTVNAKIVAIRSTLAMAEPVAACVYCAGKGCEVCNGLGYLSKALYESAPQKLKNAAAAS
jgi:hypothetical protein